MNRDLLEVEIDTNFSKNENINKIKERLSSISNRTKDIAEEVTSTITMMEVEDIGGTNEFKNFIEQQEELAKPFTLIEKTTHMLSTVPILGSAFNKVYQDMKSASIDTSTVTEAAEKMYENMIAKNKMVADKVVKLYEMEEEISTMIIDLEDLFLDLKKIIEETEQEEDSADKKIRLHKLKKLSISVQKKIKSLSAEQASIKQIGFVVEDLSLTIEESLPSDKNDLLRGLGLFSTITGAQKNINEYLALKEMIRKVDDSSSRATINILNSILDAKDTDNEDMKRMEQRTKETQKALENIQHRIESSKKETEKTYAAISENTTKFILENKEKRNG